MAVPRRLVRTFKKLGQLSTFVQFQTELLGCVQEDTENSAQFLQDFRRLETNLARVNFLYESLRRYNLLESKFTEDLKNDRKANKHREKANKLFASGSHSAALQYYTRSVMKAKTAEVLAMAYANRSAALFKLDLREESLADIERALPAYPDHLKPSLLSRREKLTAMETPSTLPFHEPAPELPRKHPENEAASDCLALETDAKGRVRVLAARDIAVGEVVAVEAPIGFTVAGAELYHCHHCFRLCYSPLPCLGCSQTVYCSAPCRDAARQAYHEHECPILASLKNMVGKHKAFLLSVKMAFGEAQTGGLARLLDNMSAEDVHDELFTTALVTALIYHLVKTRTKKFEVEDEEVENAFKESLMVYLRMCLVHAAGIDELRPIEIREDGKQLGQELLQFKSETVGCALYPFYGLLRHACCPNVFAHHHGLNRVLRAIRTIKKGQECLVSYGPYYVEHRREDRQSRLRSQYHFTCKCRACAEDWPQLDLQPYYITSRDDLVFVSEIRDANVETAKNSIPKYIERVKNLEDSEPSSELTLQQKLLSYCYDVIGNKRRVI